MRAPTPSEPKSTFPTYQVPQVSAMRGSAPPVQVARAAWGGRADPPSQPIAAKGATSVINGSSCRLNGNSNIRMQSVTENCLLNSVTVPKIQRKDHCKVAHNNSDKLVCKFGALPLGRDIPNQKSDDLEVLDLNALKNLTSCDNNDEHCDDDEMCREPHVQRTSDNHTPPLRLRGGGESSLSTGTSGWGTPPSQQASNNNANTSSGWGTANPANQNNTGTQQWNNNANRPPTSSQGPTQDANKANSNLNSNGQQQTPASQPNNSSWGQPGAKPPTTNNGPQPTTSTSSAKPPNPTAQPNTTTSTKQQLEQLNNMREAIFSQDGWGGQHVNQDTNWDIPGSPEPSMKMDGSAPPPWKPAINNGTELWEANLRNGGQPPPQPQQKTPWGHTPSTNIGGTWGEDDDADSSNVWTGVPSGQQQWGNTANSGGMWGGPKKESEWGAAAGNPGWGDPRTATDPRATGGIDPRDMRPDLRDMRAGSSDPMRLLDPREQMRLAGSDMRGDPRGITGRLNGAGAADAFWGQAGPHTGTQHIHHQNKMPVGPGNGAGWEEPSPPTQRRSHWKDLPTGASMGRGSTAGPPGMAQSRIKPDGSVWCHGRNGSWDETGPGWDESVGGWNKQKMAGTHLWGDNEIDWGHNKGPKQNLTKEMIWNSKCFRMLMDMGYKKEDVETALRRGDMNYEDALEILGSRNPDGWRNRHDDHYDHQQFPGQRFPSGPPGQMSFPQGNNAPNLLNNMNSSGGPNNSLINNISPAGVHKMLTQGGGGSQGFGAVSAAGRNLQPQSQPSTQQLRMLVQQIQMAVQAGYLNHQILNQPLAPQTLILLNQLLQQIKTLQQLMTQQSVAQSQCINGKPNSALLQCSVLITKTKQQITNLQNQIAAQQAIYVKQQNHGSIGGGQSDLFKTAAPMHDSINALQSNFADLGIKDQVNQSQSRLNQWINKDKEEGGEFSRAPGSSSKPLATSPNMNPLGLTQPDGPWSSGRTGDGGWPESGGGDSSNDGKDAQWPTPTQPSLSDLVPEFEPGKPWKGNQIKSIEDDPSITPGSVVRSSLSIATIKDTELFQMNPNNKSPPAGDTIQPLSLSSSTWSFNPPSSTSSAFTSPQNKLPSSKSGLGELNPTTAVTSELWAAPKSRGPPPGLSAKGGALVNGWSSAASWGGGQRGSGSWGGSPWLLLRNLTAQIDGSTLRTLCMQHGPLQSFHLYLHQGFALAKYSTREEATKAQTALNNCVLGNTTILAENPSEWDANALLQQVASQQSSSGAWRGSTKQPSTGSDTWSTGWSNSQSSASLWGSTTLDTTDPARATPSSLNSFLPGDLLGGESM
ncbi:protein Gawky isoform X3 [Tribolium castaneum]|uniref:protein Gawky isoform X3 n=1 Tax=Tribolium castaneum TaxID=7070 RepID=UPI00046C0562|nr:PREDICTED: protein Gawky isoform X3 [Tribolium castaneum]|eukprot:XP_015838344.1 PREDICTED: protein Gawky isoform X3 [Tribolium castaneum]